MGVPRSAAEPGVLTVCPCVLSPQIEADFRANGECGPGAPLAQTWRPRD